MAKYEVTYKCGHTGTVELFGKSSDRERKIAWYEGYCVCPECYAAEQAEKRSEEVKKYALPDLSGTEKQVAWAEKIRSKYISLREKQAEKNEELYATLNKIQDKAKNVGMHKSLFRSFYDEFFAETKASEWIDRDKNCDPSYFSLTFRKYCEMHIND